MMAHVGEDGLMTLAEDFFVEFPQDCRPPSGSRVATARPTTALYASV
jgi:hypothetical protein